MKTEDSLDRIPGIGMRNNNDDIKVIELEENIKSEPAHYFNLPNLKEEVK